jgi:hypothetical protein
MTATLYAGLVGDEIEIGSQPVAGEVAILEVTLEPDSCGDMQLEASATWTRETADEVKQAVYTAAAATLEKLMARHGFVKYSIN